MIPFLLLFSLLIFSCERLDTAFIEEDLLQRPQAKRCADCHAKIFDEWKESRHAKAWISENFALETENYTKRKCLSCHAPHQVDPQKKPVVRAEFKEDGVSCVACHFKEETKAMHGPLKVWSPPHPSVQDINYEKSTFCASCHVETYKEWKRANVNKTCQSCHMPYKGKDYLIQKFPYFLFHFRKPRHDHGFPSLVAKAEDIRVYLKGRFLILENVGVPHNLPTADQGDPKLYVVAEVVSSSGKRRVLRRILSPQAKNALGYRKPKKILIPVKDIKLVKVKIYRRLAWSKEKELIKQAVIANHQR